MLPDSSCSPLCLPLYVTGRHEQLNYTSQLLSTDVLPFLGRLDLRNMFPRMH